MKKVYHTTGRLYLFFTLLFSFFGIVIGISTSVINYYIDQKQTEEKIRESALDEYNTKKSVLQDYTLYMERMIQTISQNPITTQYIRTGSDSDRERLNDFFYPAIYSNKEVTQFRMLDETGHERVRLQRQDGIDNIITFTKGMLQNKGDRYYFTETKRLYDGGFWHSKLDLNVEMGKLEEPYVPTFRIASPIYYDNAFRGIIISNINIQGMLDDIINSPDFEIYLYDNEGEILIAPNPDHSWTRYKDTDLNIYNLFPDFREQLLNDGNHITTDHMIFNLEDIFKNGSNVRLLMLPKAAMLKHIKNNNLLTAAIIAGIVLLISLPLSWIVSIAPSRLQINLVNAFDKIRKFNFIIDSNVATTASDIKGNITDVSTKLLELTGYERSEVIGQKQSFLRHPDTPQDLAKTIWYTIRSGKIWEGEIRLRTKDGGTIWFYQTITPELNKLNEVIGYTSVASDITDKKRIEELSMRDRLTGLFNRHKLDIVLAAEQERFKRYGSNFCAVIIDADHFKNVNDTYGHQVGDYVLKKLAKLMQENSRQTDFVGRWGGEEFLIIATETELEQAQIMAEKLRTIIEKSDFAPAERVTVSIGIAQYTKGEPTAKFINRADEALYEAKQTGRNRVCISKNK
jgi:diguanylate cyclase (GGDEF)-like protein/PAS domain S-box-containing protein